VDLSSGGTIDGMIRAADAVLQVADSATRIIPGHGPLADRRRLAVYRDMLAGIRDEVARRVAAGESLETVVAARPSARFDAEWGRGWITPARFVEIVYRDLARRR
jgi:cyclase